MSMIDICDNPQCRRLLLDDKYAVIRKDGKRCFLCKKCFEQVKAIRVQEERRQKQAAKKLFLPKDPGEQMRSLLNPKTDNPKNN